MSEDLSQLKVSLALQTEQFTKGVAQVNRSLDRVQRNSKETSRAMTGINTAMAGLRTKVIGAAVALGSMFTVQQAKAAISYADTLGKTASKLGITTDALQQYRFAAEQSGVKTTTFDMALQRFARRSGEARKGMGELTKVYQELGIELKDTEGRFKTTEILFNEFAEAISNAGDEQEKLRLAFKGFDSEGAALVNMLKDGASGLAAFKKEANGLGLVIDKELIARAEQLQNKLGVIETRWNAFKTELFVGTAGSVFKTIINAEEADAEIAKVEDRIQKLQRTIADASDVGLLTTMMVGGDAVDVDRLVEDLARLEAELTKLQATRKKFADDAAAESPEAILAGQWGDSFRAASAATEEFDKSIADWAQKIALSADPARVLEENMIKLEIALENGAISADEYAKAVAYLTPKIKKVKDPAAELAKELDRIADTMNKSFDPAYSFGQQMIEINRVFDAGKISAEVYAAAVLDAQSVFDTGARNPTDIADEIARSVDPTIEFNEQLALMDRLLEGGQLSAENYGLALGNMVADLSATGDKIKEQKSLWEQMEDEMNIVIDLNQSWGDNFKAIGKEVVATMIEIILKQQLMAAAMKFIPGFGGAFAQGGAFVNGVQAFAHGGIVGPGFGGARSFPMAGGKMGLMGEAGNEAIMPLSRTGAGDLGIQMSVNIQNHNPGAKVEVEESGNGEINIIIDKVASDIVRGGGKISRALERTYNVRR